MKQDAYLRSRWTPLTPEKYRRKPVEGVYYWVSHLTHDGGQMVSVAQYNGLYQQFYWVNDIGCGRRRRGFIQDVYAYAVYKSPKPCEMKDPFLPPPSGKVSV